LFTKLEGRGDLDGNPICTDENAEDAELNDSQWMGHFSPRERGDLISSIRFSRLSVLRVLRVSTGGFSAGKFHKETSRSVRELQIINPWRPESAGKFFGSRATKGDFSAASARGDP
jgi:hypothetical protein